MIEFENVSFSYTGQEHGGLRDINLKISDGEFVLFCGRSGCGKTTITRLVNGLIPQFYQGELHGRVLVDGQEISKGRSDWCCRPQRSWKDYIFPRSLWASQRLRWTIFVGKRAD